jgi:hypothetical protein
MQLIHNSSAGSNQAKTDNGRFLAYILAVKD